MFLFAAMSVRTAAKVGRTTYGVHFAYSVMSPVTGVGLMSVAKFHASPVHSGFRNQPPKVWLVLYRMPGFDT
jgi:hypothetical protein